jgi:hypothetical protein
MSTILTETSTFTATVTAPDDGDPATGAAVTTGLQSLTNRTLYLKDTVEEIADGSGLWTPTITAGSGMTGAASNVYGQYLKLGAIVFFTLQFEMAEDGTDSGGNNDRTASFTLPIARAGVFANNRDATGVASGYVSASDLQSTGGIVRALAADVKLWLASTILPPFQRP